jgi:hypothetical protein
MAGLDRGKKMTDIAVQDRMAEREDFYEVSKQDRTLEGTSIDLCAGNEH